MNTKGYAILLAIIVVIGFTFIGLIVFHDPVLVKQRPITVYLSIDSMKEASDNVLDTVNGPAVYNIYPANHRNTKNDTIPWADAYLCHTFCKADSLSGDTLVLILDTKTNENLYKVKYPSDYWTGLKKMPKFTKCKIMISPAQLVYTKNARYKFAKVQLIADDDDGLK